MAETIGGVVVLLLAVYGCVQGMRRLVLRLLRCPPRTGVWLIPLKGHREDVEYLVRSAAATCRWGGWQCGEACLINVDADAATCDLAQKACQTVNGVRYTEPEDLLGLFCEN